MCLAGSRSTHSRFRRPTCSILAVSSGPVSSSGRRALSNFAQKGSVTNDFHSHLSPTPFWRNVELMWLTGRLAPDFKTIADFRKDNGEAIRLVCREFVMLCRKLNLLRTQKGSVTKGAESVCPISIPPSASHYWIVTSFSTTSGYSTNGYLSEMVKFFPIGRDGMERKPLSRFPGLSRSNVAISR